MDPEGRLLPTGEPGEIVIRSALALAGYYKNFVGHRGGEIKARLLSGPTDDDNR